MIQESNNFGLEPVGASGGGSWWDREYFEGKADGTCGEADSTAHRAWPDEGPDTTGPCDFLRRGTWGASASQPLELIRNSPWESQ